LTSIAISDTTLHDAKVVQPCAQPADNLVNMAFLHGVGPTYRYDDPIEHARRRGNVDTEVA
jgi:hypothetical protein